MSARQRCKIAGKRFSPTLLLWFLPFLCSPCRSSRAGRTRRAQASILLYTAVSLVDFVPFMLRGASYVLCPRQVVVESRERSLSQTYWSMHQASDGGVHASTIMKGALARLESEIVRLRIENTR